MMKRILLACISLFFLGCGNFLDINPESEVVNDDMFSTAEGVEDALYGVYMSMVKEDMYGGDMSVLIPELLGQNFVTDDGYLVYVSRLDNENSYARNMTKKMWPGSYLVISYLNNIIENLDQKSVKDFKYYDLYRGEALGLRATIHFDLLRLFAVHINSTDENAKAKAIPYVTKYTFKVTPFSSVEEVYEKIIADLKEAETCLVEDETLMPKIRKGGEKGFTGARELHFNLYAAQAMLARVYWMKGDLKNAKKYADKVIQSEKFQFVNQEDLPTFMKRRISLSETIWGLYTTNISSYLYDRQLLLNKMSLPTGWKDIYKTVGENEGSYDKRYYAWFVIKEYSGKSKDILSKIMDESNDASEYSGGAYFGFSMIRIPEMYYIMAEALLEEGDKEHARDYLDAVVSARGMVKFADRDTDKDITLDDIMNERRKELFGEGHWWFCLKRLNRDVYVHALDATLKGSDRIYTLPLPTDELDPR